MTESLDLIEYDVTDEAIATLKDKYTGLTADNNEQYGQVTKAIADVRNLRTSVEKRRKELKAEALDYGRKVDAKAKDITARLLEVEEPLKAVKQVVDDKRAKLKAEVEEKERKRVEDIKAAIEKIHSTPIRAIKLSIPDMQEIYKTLQTTDINDNNFAEFVHEAQGTLNRAIEELGEYIVNKSEAERQEREAAEKAKQVEQDMEKAEAVMAEQRAAQEAEREALDKERAEFEAQKATDAAVKAKEEMDKGAPAFSDEMLAAEPDGSNPSTVPPAPDVQPEERPEIDGAVIVSQEVHDMVKRARPKPQNFEELVLLVRNRISDFIKDDYATSGDLESLRDSIDFHMDKLTRNAA